jgi:hypothetical protein
MSRVIGDAQDGFQVGESFAPGFAPWALLGAVVGAVGGGVPAERGGKLGERPADPTIIETM